MGHDFPAIDHRRGVTVPALLFWAAVASTLPVFWITVGPSLGGGAKVAHASHWLLVVLHGLCGALTLIAGFAALYMGWTRQAFGWHRHTGCTYVGAGMMMAFLSMVFSLQNRHDQASLSWSTGLLSVAWLVTTSMGWRRGSQRQWASHQRWMIRSMVLTWSFVFCRLASRIEDFDSVYPALGVWLYWVGPLVIAEAGLWWWSLGRQPQREGHP